MKKEPTRDRAAQRHDSLSRRQVLKASACGFGHLALAGLAHQQAVADSPGYQSPLSPRVPHRAPRARQVIFLYMNGGPSHVDSFDYKPLLFRDKLPDNLLRPGQYGKIRVATSNLKNALLIPQRAVTEMQGVFQVAVVGADKKVEIKAVETGPRVGSLWVIQKGLSKGDQIIVEGASKVKPGMEVNPQPVPPEGQKSAEKSAASNPGT